MGASGCCYARATRCAVLSWRMLVPGGSAVNTCPQRAEAPIGTHTRARIYGDDACVYRRDAAVYGRNAVIYGGNAAIYGRNAAIYGRNSAVYGGGADSGGLHAQAPTCARAARATTGTAALVPTLYTLGPRSLDLRPYTPDPRPWYRALLCGTERAYGASEWSLPMALRSVRY
eukprot:1777522-Rhodomonas_salina.2